MPPALALLPVILGIAGAATGATELGLQLAHGSGGGGKVQPPTPQQIASNRAQLASVVQQNLGNLQESGGGGLSPNYAASVIGSETGTLNQTSELQDIIKNLSNGGPATGGTPTPGSTGGGGGGTFDIAEYLKSLGTGGAAPPNFASLSIPEQSNDSLSAGGLVDSKIFGG